MIKILIEEFINAYKGKILWRKLRRRYGTGNEGCRYIFFSDKDIEYSVLGLLYMDSYIKDKKVKQVIPIIKDKVLKKSFQILVQSTTVEPILISEKRMHQLMKFYALVDMSDQWISVSVKEPYDTYAEHLLGHHGVTKKELICYDIFKMNNVPVVAIPSVLVLDESYSFIRRILKKYIKLEV